MTMKFRILFGAAVPLAITAAAASAQAQVSTATTTPLKTSTTGNVSIVSGGSITLNNSPGAAAVTVDSNNTVSNAGAIAVNNSNNGVGVLINPNFTTSYSGAGSITLGEDYTQSDTNKDNVLDGVFAQGSNRFGILLAPGGTMTGDVRVGGTVSVKGNHSAGVSLQSLLTGSYVQSGAVVVTGSNSIGVDLQKNISGDVILGSTTSAQGQNSVGVRLLGDIAGEFQINGTISATGFSSTSVSNYGTNGSTTLLAENLLNGGSAVVIRGNLANGLLINGAAPGASTTAVNDPTLIQSFNGDRTTASLGSTGSAPALVIAPDTAANGGHNITLNLARESVRDLTDNNNNGDKTEIVGVFNYSYGLMNRGAITASGLNKGFDSTGALISGSSDGAFTTTIAGGVNWGGTSSAQAFEANAIGLRFGSGAITPKLDVTGSLSSTVYSSGTNTAVAVQVDAGSNIPVVNNTGTISAVAHGFAANPTGFLDKSGNVLTFNNTGKLLSSFVDDDTTDSITSGTGVAVAADFTATTGNVTFNQNEVFNNARVLGAIKFGSGSDTMNLLSGRDTGDISFGTGSDTLNIGNATLTGNVTFGGTGAAVTMSSGGTFTGNLAFGSASSTFALSGGSTYTGIISNATGAPLTISANASTLQQNAGTTVSANSLSFTNGSTLIVGIDNARANSATPVFQVSGAANLSANTTVKPVFSEFVNKSVTVRVINAGSLTLGGPAAAMLKSTLPFVYDPTLTQNGNGLDLSLRIKSTTELGIKPYAAAPFNAVLEMLSKDSTVGAAVAGLTDKASFAAGYTALTPVSDGTLLQVLASDVDVSFGATSRRLDLLGQKSSGTRTGWVEEYGLDHTITETGSGVGVNGGGFGAAAGYDLITRPNSVIGIYGTLDSIELKETGRDTSPFNLSRFSGGLYGGSRSGALGVTGAVSAGYLSFAAKRAINIGTFKDNTKATWSGWDVTAGGRATYDIPLGFATARPYLGANYLYMNQDARNETSAGGYALALQTDGSTSSLATASTGVQFTADLGGDETLRVNPELNLGYRAVVAYDGGSAKARYKNGTQSFLLPTGADPESAAVVGLGFNIGSEYLNLKIGYDGQFGSNTTTHYGSISLRVSFW